MSAHPNIDMSEHRAISLRFVTRSVRRHLGQQPGGAPLPHLVLTHLGAAAPDTAPSAAAHAPPRTYGGWLATKRSDHVPIIVDMPARDMLTATVVASS